MQGGVGSAGETPALTRLSMPRSLSDLGNRGEAGGKAVHCSDLFC